MEPRSTLTSCSHLVWFANRDPDEDLDPYGNAPPSGPDGPPPPPPPEDPPPSGGFPTLAVVAAGAVGFLLAIGLLLAWALWPTDDANDWHPPIARLAERPPLAAALAERVHLDASPSVASPGRTLTYHWAVTSPDEVDVLFQDDGSPRIARRSSYPTLSPLVSAQFFTAGPVRLELRVHDGVDYSDPVVLELEIVDARASSAAAGRML